MSVCNLSSPGAFWEKFMDVALLNILPNPYGFYKAAEFGFDEVKNVFKCGLSGLFKSCHNTPTTISTSVYNQIISQSVFDVISTCDGSIVSNQWMVANCTTTAKSELEPGKPYGQNQGCLTCLKVKQALFDNRRELETRAFEQNTSHVMDALTGDIAVKWNNPDTFPCIYACQACVVQNLEQKAQIKLDQNCRQQVSWVENIQQRIQTNVKQTLVDQKDVFGALSDSLLTNTDCIASDVAQRLKQRITNKFVTNLLIAIENSQEFTVAPNSTSIYVNKVKQSINVNSVATLVARENIVSGLYSDFELDEAQKLINKNDSIGDLANALIETSESLNKIFKGLVTKLLITVGSVLFGAVIFMVIILVMQKKSKHKAV